MAKAGELDILAISAHPDDVELCASGTVIKHIEKGYKIGLIDLTRGELGTRGTADIRAKEAADAAKILGVEFRENLGMADGFFENNRENQLAIIRKIRQYRPRLIFTNAIRDRHIDHGRASELVSHAAFLSGLRKIETQLDGQQQEAWRPKAVYHFVQDRHIEPHFVVDITEQFEKKVAAIKAFKSQFFTEEEPDSKEPVTPISTYDFMEFIKSRAREMGRPAGYTYAEGWTAERYIGVKDMMELD